MPSGHMIVKNGTQHELRTVFIPYDNCTIKTRQNQGEALYIINSVGIAYHQRRKTLYLIKPRGNTTSLMIYTLKRDNIPSLGLG